MRKRGTIVTPRWLEEAYGKKGPEQKVRVWICYCIGCDKAKLPEGDWQSDGKEAIQHSPDKYQVVYEVRCPYHEPIAPE